MERRRDERLSVALKAALLDDGTLPRGCRVRDFSQRGMLLQYDYDGNAATFNHGDTVTVRLSLPQDDEPTVLTLPSTVRRVDQHGIGIEFDQPEAQLLALLEPYRLDRPRLQGAALEEDRADAVKVSGTSVVTPLLRPRARHRLLNRRSPASAPGGSEHRDRRTAHAPGGSEHGDRRTAYPTAATEAARPGQQAAPVLTDRRMFYVGLASLVCAVLILIIDSADTAGLKKRLRAMEAGNWNVASELGEMRDRLSAVTGSGQAFSDLNARVDTLAVSVAALQGRLTLALGGQSIEVAGTEKAPPAPGDSAAALQGRLTPASGGQSIEVAGREKAPPAPGDSAAALQGRLTPASGGQSIEVAGREKAPPAPGDSAAGQGQLGYTGPEATATNVAGEVNAAPDRSPPGSDAPWVINLVSLYDKAAADGFMDRAKSKGVRVDQNRVTVKGKQVWRLQIAGFTTQQEARAYGATATEKLGLKEAWVFKR